MSEAFRVYSMDAPQQPRTLKEKINRRRNELANYIVNGQVSDWADYRRRIGVIEGLEEAMVLCDEVEDEQRK